MICDKCKNCLIQEYKTFGKVNKIKQCLITKEVIVKEPLSCNQSLPDIKYTDVSKKSIAELIDAHITTNIKCFMIQDRLMESKTNEDSAIYAKQAQRLNKQRCDIMRAVDIELGYGENTVTEKTYCQEK